MELIYLIRFRPEHVSNNNEHIVDPLFCHVIVRAVILIDQRGLKNIPCYTAFNESVLQVILNDNHLKIYGVNGLSSDK